MGDWVDTVNRAAFNKKKWRKQWKFNSKRHPEVQQDSAGTVHLELNFICLLQWAFVIKRQFTNVIDS